MSRACEACGVGFEAKHATARFCSDRCRKRHKRQGGGTVVQFTPRAAESDPVDDARIGLESSLLAMYSDDLLASPRGQLAVKLARDVDQMFPGMTGYAPMVAQMRGLIDDLTGASAKKAANPLTLIRDRHAGNRATG
jgi:hypothetical protein